MTLRLAMRVVISTAGMFGATAAVNADPSLTFVPSQCNYISEVDTAVFAPVDDIDNDMHSGATPGIAHCESSASGVTAEGTARIDRAPDGGPSASVEGMLSPTINDSSTVAAGDVKLNDGSTTTVQLSRGALPPGTLFTGEASIQITINDGGNYTEAGTWTIEGPGGTLKLQLVNQGNTIIITKPNMSQQFLSAGGGATATWNFTNCQDGATFKLTSATNVNGNTSDPGTVVGKTAIFTWNTTVDVFEQ